MHYIVYETTNLINNKIYIGVHKTENLNDGYLGSGVGIKRAITKYGKENFSREVIEFCGSYDDALALEAELVNEEFISRRDTYNIIKGGYEGFADNAIIGGYASLEQGAGVHGLSKERLIELGNYTVENKLGIHGMSKEDNFEAGELGRLRQKENGIGIYSKEWQEKYRESNIAKMIETNTGVPWYNDGKNEYKYSKKQQKELSFEEFLTQNPQFKSKRLRINLGKKCVTNSIINKWMNGIVEAEQFILDNPEFRFGQTNFKKYTFKEKEVNK